MDALQTTESSKKQALFLRLLLNKYFAGKADQLFKLMPQEELTLLNAVSSPLKDPTLLLFNPEAWLTQCDPSWYQETVSSLPESLQEVYMRILPKPVFANAKEKYAENSGLAPLVPKVREFLLLYFHDLWLKQFKDKEPMVKDYIEHTSLSPLLELTKADLLSVADLLSMHHLVDEVRHIVDKRILQVLSQVLTVQQQQYLRMCLRQKTKAHPSPVSLRELLAEPKKIKGILHRQGLKRLAIALSGQSKDFIWYILHTLDVARAKFIQAEIKEEPLSHATKLAQLETLQILQFLKTG